MSGVLPRAPGGFRGRQRDLKAGFAKSSMVGKGARAAPARPHIDFWPWPQMTWHFHHPRNLPQTDLAGLWRERGWLHFEILALWRVVGLIGP